MDSLLSAADTALRTLFAARCADPGVFVLRDKQGEAIGDIGLRISSKNPHEADVGYALIPQAQGQGYASEALRAICDYGFSQLGVNAINAWVLGDNIGSARLLEKQGFVRIQVLEKAYEMVMSGEIKDGKTIAGILKLKALLAEGKL